MYSIEKVTEKTRKFVDALIEKSWAGPFCISLGVLYDTREKDGFVAIDSNEVIGYVLYDIVGDSCEINVLESLQHGKGIGTALINTVKNVARKNDCNRLWLTTTNDNTHAIRFYQRHGFSLRAVHINAMEHSRKLKPQMPLIGFDDIPINHEFEFEMIMVEANNRGD
ncbi:MAG: GNAT family N-acetyltransferase [Defluviitaleaceae bacterium]|nr:GNAT family N-acetyltransferase [Defluviitaleaceae bacterium]